MTNSAVKRLACATIASCVVASTASLRAQLELGTWVQQSGSTAGLTMTIEACCNGGRRLVYRLNGRSDALMTLDTKLDGVDAPVLVGGKPSGETMAIKRVDALHADTVIKMDGQPFATSKATLSADGKTLTVVNDVTFAGGGQKPGKSTEIWVRK